MTMITIPINTTGSLSVSEVKRFVKEVRTIKRFTTKKRFNVKRPQPWSWAQAHEERVRKHWNWKLLDAKWENTKAQALRCTPLSHYGWKAFGFDGKQKPIWTIADYVDMVENYEDPSDYVGMGWVDSRGRP